MKVMRQVSDAIPVFVFTYANFPDKNIYAANKYIHMTQVITEDRLFFLSEAPVPGIGSLAFDINDRTDGAEVNNALNLLSGHTSNIRSDNMEELRSQGIDIYDDKNPALDNVRRQCETTAGTGNCRREGIICPRKSGNLQNSFAYFRHHPYDAVLRTSLLHLFLIIFPEEFLDQVLIPKTKKGMSVPMDLQDFIK